MMIRDNPDITRVSKAGLNHKINLFADFALLDLSSILSTLLNLHRTLAQFAQLLGFTVNQNKSTALNFTFCCELVSHIQAHWTSLRPIWAINESSFYLFSVANYYTLLRSLTTLLQSQKCLSLLWIGRINMVTLDLWA